MGSLVDVVGERRVELEDVLGLTVSTHEREVAAPEGEGVVELVTGERHSGQVGAEREDAIAPFAFGRDHERLELVDYELVAVVIGCKLAGRRWPELMALENIVIRDRLFERQLDQLVTGARIMHRVAELIQLAVSGGGFFLAIQEADARAADHAQKKPREKVHLFQ